MREEQDGRTIQDVLASEASLVGIERIAGKTDRRFGHWGIVGMRSALSAMGGKTLAQAWPSPL
jgi:hypothetical protein